MSFKVGHPDDCFVMIYIIFLLSLCKACGIIYLQVLIIEVNTVPGMTPSTVLIHQVILKFSIHKQNAWVTADMHKIERNNQKDDTWVGPVRRNNEQ